MTRVIAIDMMDCNDRHVGDFASREDTLDMARKNNDEARLSFGDVYYVYDDEGNCINLDAAKLSS